MKELCVTSHACRIRTTSAAWHDWEGGRGPHPLPSIHGGWMEGRKTLSTRAHFHVGPRRCRSCWRGRERERNWLGLSCRRGNHHLTSFDHLARPVNRRARQKVRTPTLPPELSKLSLIIASIFSLFPASRRSPGRCHGVRAH
jgi:hypothetical protein